ncbi:Hypothetical protein FKW44_016440 [Caligus rogercresseyi]|uniref:Uncharacterized protein n=1 Tax=Caligus rogercresseyi TaxID=217165 RepID=A0A7T8H1W7_CALRO|nr:Hypothetical protein FKW44_016440 [Caligus rogercresseyi]
MRTSDYERVLKKKLEERLSTDESNSSGGKSAPQLEEEAPVYKLVKNRHLR